MTTSGIGIRWWSLRERTATAIRCLCCHRILLCLPGASFVFSRLRGRWGRGRRFDRRRSRVVKKPRRTCEFHEQACGCTVTHTCSHCRSHRSTRQVTLGKRTLGLCAMSLLLVELEQLFQNVVLALRVLGFTYPIRGGWVRVVLVQQLVQRRSPLFGKTVSRWRLSGLPIISSGRWN